MKTISSTTFAIDVPLSLTGCSGRDRQSVVVKWRERWRHISSMTFIIDVPLSLTDCCGRSVGGKNKDTISSMTFIIDVPLSLTPWAVEIYKVW